MAPLQRFVINSFFLYFFSFFYVFVFMPFIVCYFYAFIFYFFFCRYNFSGIHKQIRHFVFNKLIGKPSSPMPLISVFRFHSHQQTNKMSNRQSACLYQSFIFFITIRSPMQTMKNINMQIKRLETRKQCKSKTIPLVCIRCIFLLSAFLSFSNFPNYINYFACRKINVNARHIKWRSF